MPPQPVRICELLPISGMVLTNPSPPKWIRSRKCTFAAPPMPKVTPPRGISAMLLNAVFPKSDPASGANK